jgi:hypothetical protein
MKLGVKISLLIGVCVLLATLGTTLTLSRVFISDQESYLKELQTTVALTAKRELETRSEILYQRIADLVDSSPESLTRVVSPILSAELWRMGELTHHSPGVKNKTAPPAGASNWSLLVSDAGQSDQIRWIGRYGEKFVVLGLHSDWLNSALKISHGNSLQIINSKGVSLFGLGTQKDVLLPQDFLSRSAALPDGIPETRSFQSKQTSWIATSIKMPTDPPMFLVVSAPSEAISRCLLDWSFF